MLVNVDEHSMDKVCMLIMVDILLGKSILKSNNEQYWPQICGLRTVWTVIWQ